MSHLSLSLFGPFQAVLDERPLQKFRTNKVQALLIYLTVDAIDHPAAHRRDALMELLWPGLPLKSAQNNLRQTIYLLRKTIPELNTNGDGATAPFLISRHQTVQINPDAAYDLDAAQFSRLLDESQRHDHASLLACAACQNRLERAASLYAGPFLADFYLEDSNTFEDWAWAKREAYRRRALDALDALTAVALHQAAYPQARQFAERQLEIDGLRESAYRQLMEILARSGQASEAVALYETCRRRLREELGMEPTERTTAVYQQILSGEVSLTAEPVKGVRGYELQEKIGAGAIGAVHRALQPGVGREVAVKIILPQYANRPDFIRRFEAEARLVAQLEHPHIVPLYDFWREPDGAYLVMRYLRGGSLGAALGNGRWPLEAVLQLSNQLTSALAAAHRYGIVHRDIKPDNILLDDEGNSYLTDFGLAKVLTVDGSVTEDSVKGSPAYISPEQLTSEPVSPATDLYSLGIVLYEALTGERPYPGASLASLLFKHLNEPLPLVGDKRDDVPEAVDAVIQRATAKKPADRYQDAPSLAAAFAEAIQTPVNGRTLFPAVVLPDIDEVDIFNPYKGLRPFQEADAGHFFGRDGLIQQLLQRLGDSRFLAVVGPSGSGKSSVVKAGLVPRLRQNALPGSENWYFIEMMPGAHPFEELEAALLRVAVNPPPSLQEPLLKDERGLVRTVKRALPDDGELFLVIDQFEELFTLVEDEEKRNKFLDNLVTAVTEPRSRIRIIATLRADFYDRPLQYPQLGELMRQSAEVVLPLTPAELEQAITGPAASVGVGLEPGLVTAIIADVNEQPGALPILQYALTELFERRDGRRLTLAVYEEIGGVLGALDRRAEAIYANLGEPGQQAARQLFLRLVTLGEGVEDTRRRVLQAELEQLSVNGNQLSVNSNPITDYRTPNTAYRLPIAEYGKHRLLTFDRDPITRGPTVEVAHEALLREWPRLRRWLDDSRHDVRQQRLLAAAATEWLAAGQDEGYLLRGSRLNQFASWAQQTSLALTGDECAFLQASVAARQQRQAEEEARRQRELETARQLAQEQSQRAEEQARAANRLRLFAAGLAVILLIAIGAAGLAVRNGDEAQANLLESERSRLALQAQNALDRGEGADLASLLAMRSLQLGYSPEADQALQAALTDGFPRQAFTGHTDDIQMVVFSPDGRQLASGGNDGIARLWDAQTGKELQQFIGHEAAIILVDISPDGRYLATSASDNTVRLWDIQTGQQINQFPGHRLAAGINFSSNGQKLLIGVPERLEIRAVPSGDVISQFETISADTGWTAELSPDDRYIVTAPITGQVRLWDAQTGEELRQLTGHVGWVGYASFSPDGQYILTTGQDGTARIWDVASGKELRRFVGHSDAVFNGFFSPDGRYVVTGSYDKTARVWDVSSGRELERFGGHTDFVNVAFSPDSRMIATASGDRTIKLWDIHTEPEPRQLADFSLVHLQDQTAITVSPDGQFTLVGRISGLIEIVNNQTHETVIEVETGDLPITTYALSLDNNLLVSGNRGGLVQLFDGQSGEVLWQFGGHDEAVTAVAFSPDGRFILTASEDGTARLLDTQTGRELRSLTGHEGGVTSAAFSPDGDRILTGGEDNTARLWDAAGGEELAQFTGHTGHVHAVAFASDGRTIVTGSEDNTARIWDVESGETVQTFIGHTDLVLRVAFAPDGRFLLTGSEDQTARLWDVATGDEVHQYAGHISALFHVGFSADGQTVYTADSQAAYAWRTTLDDVIAFACGQLTRDFSGEERAFYGINDDEPTCPEPETAVAQIQPTWTPYATSAAPVVGPSLVTEMAFVPMETANIQMGIPFQHVYIAAGPDVITRPFSLDPEILNQPIFNSTEFISDTLEAPFELGPFPKGEPIGLTVAEWNAAEGHGTYTLTGNRAFLDLTFAHLIPNGVYTIWCVKIQLVPEFEVLEELPCGALDGSENNVIVDENGNGFIQLEMDPFPVSTEEIIYEIALAYHSDGLTHGITVGEFGKNAHVQLIYDFLPPGQ